MRPSRIKAKLARDEPALVTTLHLTDPSIHELVSLMGFDGIWLDMEHHTYSLETAAGLMRAARVGSTDILARPANGEFPRLSRMLEAGANGIMYPRCRDAAEAREVVRWAKFAPLGARGFDGGNPDMPYCSMDMEDYLQTANRETFVLIQLEDPRALDQAEAIAAVDGVDAIMLGPADFSILSGAAGQFQHATVREAIERVATAAKNAGKVWAAIAPTGADAAQLLERGARLLMHGADLLMIRQGLEQIQRDFRRLGFRFDNRLEASTGRRSTS